MRQILIVDNSLEKYAELRNQLEDQLTVEITISQEIPNALSLLQLLPELDFILLNFNTYGQAGLDKFEEYLIMEKRATKLFVIGHGIFKREQTNNINFALDSVEFFNIIKDQFLSNDLNKNKILKPLFVPVDFQFILNNKKVAFPVDFYLRIKRSSDEYQYIKRLHANDLFSEEELDKLIAHKVNELYILKEDYQKFLQLRLSLSMQNQKDEARNNLEKSFDFHLTKEVISMCGVGEETQELVVKNLRAMEANISKNDSLMNYLNLINQNKNSYSYARSSLTAMILTKVVSKFEWDSPAIKSKICFVAFFHDISIVEEKLCRIHSNEELFAETSVEYQFQNNSKISDKIYQDYEIEQVQYHALNSALILEKMPNVPIGVFQVVKEHHGAKNGIGFNDGQSISLQPLSMIFIVVEDFVVEFLKLEKPVKNDINKILAVLSKKYVKGTYKKAVEALIQISN